MFAPHSARSASAYKRVGVETGMHTMDQHQIVSLLFDGLLESLATARGALARKDVAAKCASISKCIRILEEGLATGLDTVDGGALAVNLEALYDYAVRRLCLANARSDDAILQEVQRLVEPLAQSWKVIKNTDGAKVAPTNSGARLLLVEA
ncbi:MAG: flagellar export chaperone FliS [Pseudomonadota bacterium]|jgi:flagellar protein FliS